MEKPPNSRPFQVLAASKADYFNVAAPELN